MFTSPILRFSGEYRFLSNFYLHPIRFRRIVYPSNEHAFQAMKTRNNAIRRSIAEALTPGDAKRMGRALELRDDWERIRERVMLECCRRKFADPALRRMLLDTGSRRLVEGNTWGDTYWGVCKGKGQNKLGKTLMRVRKEIGEGL